jgi:hypothetical protein
MARQSIAVILVAWAALALRTEPALSQHVGSSVEDLFTGRARLFVVDNTPANPAIVVVDLPSYNVTQRIQVPGTVLRIGVNVNNSHLGVFRNRDNGQQASCAASVCACGSQLH